MGERPAECVGRDLHNINCAIHQGEVCSREPCCPRDAGLMSDAAIEMLGLNTPCRAAMLDASMAGDGAPSERVICETLQLDTLHAFKAAARSLKAAEEALVAARQVYAEAVKALSEEAVK